MARWTENFKDQKHLSKIVQEVSAGGIALITLIDGTVIEGVLRRINIGNNAGRGGWAYYGECEIETKEQKRWVIDYLDIKSATNVWSDAKAKEYEELGLITIIK